MTIEERADLAANLKATGQCNCTQSVLKVFEEKALLDIQRKWCLSSMIDVALQSART